MTKKEENYKEKGKVRENHVQADLNSVMLTGFGVFFVHVDFMAHFRSFLLY